MKSSESLLNKPLRLDLNLIEVPFTTIPSVILDLPIPPALWTINPRRLLGKVWWDKMRRQVYKRNNGCCLACGAPGQLDAHERYDYDFEAHISKFKEIVPLCHDCHMFIHWCGVDNPNKRRSILIKGMNLLKKNHLLIPESAFRAAGIWAPGFKTKLYITEKIKASLNFPIWKLDLSALQLTEKQVEHIKGLYPISSIYNKED